MKIAKEIKIGVLVLATLALLYYGFNFLKGTNIFENQRYFYTVYEDIKGLEKANSVVVNGYEIGVVTDIYFIPNDQNNRLMVEFAIHEDIPIPDDTKAVIQIDFLGSNTIGLRMGKSPKYAVSGDTLVGDVATTIEEEVNLQLKPIKNKAENLMLSLDSVLTVIQTIFNENTRENLAHSFESIKNTIQNLENTSYSLDTLMTGQRGRFEHIIGNVESISYNIKTNNEKINNIIDNFSNISDTLAKANISQTINNTNKALADFSVIMGKVNNGEGSLGQLINNDSLYNNLESASKELDVLLEDMKLHPERYVHFSVFGRGGKKNKYVSPEEEAEKEKKR